jgi:hypothetical protein
MIIVMKQPTSASCPAVFTATDLRADLRTLAPRAVASASAKRLALALLCASTVGACANGMVGIAIPIGPFGSIGLGMNGAGQVNANLGLGTHIGSVGVGGSTSVPLGTIGGTAPASGAEQAPVNAAAQSGGSQNVPR